MDARSAFTAPLRMYAEHLSAALDMGIAAQEMALQALETGAEYSADLTTLPSLNGDDPAGFTTPIQMRDVFHRVADYNLRSWEHTASLLQSVPAWARPNQMVGRALTDWFDEARRTNPLLHVPESDTPAPQSDIAQPQRPAAAPKIAKITPKSSSEPRRLDTPDGACDDLTMIKGIGPKLSEKLNTLGIFHFTQIANWSAENAAWIDDQLAFKGRVMREEWVIQAKSLAG